MTLAGLLAELAVVVVVTHLLGLRLIGVCEPRAAVRTALTTARAVLPVAVGLGALLVVNGLVRDAGVNLAWLIGLNITGAIYTLEGAVVADLQSVATPWLTTGFSLAYVFGYAVLVTFPPVAYAVAGAERPLRVTLLAYGFNYGIGVVCYLVFVAYGPRNLLAGTVDPLLFARWPDSQLLMSEVNTNTNVFPSLHTSLSITVGLVASRYRAVTPGWPVVAWPLAASITVATMYLGIHWLTDVIAGTLLAVGSVAASHRVADRLDATHPEWTGWPVAPDGNDAD